MTRSPQYNEITEYIESQFDRKTKVINLKPEHSYNELGFQVTIWNVKLIMKVHGGSPMETFR